jgi:sec-independent protein translocase protein TatA
MEGLHLVTANIFAPQELIVVLLLALIFFGAKKLPEVASGLGKAIREFQRAASQPESPDRPTTPLPSPSGVSEARQDGTHTSGDAIDKGHRDV